jgi:HEPN domain-containing protein
MPRDLCDPAHPESWLQYARSDLTLASIEPPQGVLLDSLCHHAQQAVEKALIAVLVALRVDFPPTHNLKILVELLPDGVPVPELILQAVSLTPYAVSSRYPDALGRVTDPAELEEALMLARFVVEWAEDLVVSTRTR